MRTIEELSVKSNSLQDGFGIVGECRTKGRDDIIKRVFCDVFIYYQERELTIATWPQRFTNAAEKKLPA